MSSPEPKLTARQAQVVSFMNHFRASEQCNPTMSEISAHFGWASPNAAQTHVDYLKRKGIVMARDRHQHARGYVVLAKWATL